MVADFTRYQPPGVYVEGTAENVVAPTGLPTATVTIVAQSRGYQLATQAVSLSATPVALAKKGVLPDGTGVDLKVTKADGTVLVETTDYALVRGATANDSTTIARVASSTAVAEGESVTVSYSYADATYYTPQVFDDYSLVEAYYGPAMVNTLPASPDATQVSSPLSLATRIAFENGAGRVICLPVEPPTADVTLRDRFTQAYAKVAANHDVTLLVPIFADTGSDPAAYTSGLQGFFSDARAHCLSATDDGFGRIAFVGADATYDDSTTGFDALASALNESRVVLAYPHKMAFYNGSLSQTTTIGGPYLAAAYAGILSANPINRGLTQMTVYGFSGIADTVQQEMTNSFLNSLSAAGVCVTQQTRNNRLAVRHGVTTDPSGIVSREINVVRASDALYQVVAAGLEDAGLIGDPIDTDMTMRVKGLVAGILETAVLDATIYDYTGLAVRQQSLPSGDPTAVEVRFSYRPFLPLNYITVYFSMDLMSGAVSADTAATDQTVTTV